MIWTNESAPLSPLYSASLLPPLLLSCLVQLVVFRTLTHHPLLLLSPLLTHLSLGRSGPAHLSLSSKMSGLNLLLTSLLSLPVLGRVEASHWSSSIQILRSDWLIL